MFGSEISAWFCMRLFMNDRNCKICINMLKTVQLNRSEESGMDCMKHVHACEPNLLNVSNIKG